MVHALHHIHIVFDDDNGVSLRNQLLQKLDQFCNIRKVQTRRWFIEDVERFSGSAL